LTVFLCAAVGRRRSQSSWPRPRTRRAASPARRAIAARPRCGVSRWRVPTR